MTDYPKALAAAREAHTYVKHRGMTRAEAALGDLLAALDAARGEAVAFLYTLEYGSSVADRKASTYRLHYPFGVCGADYQRSREDGVSYVRETPLYAAPPAALAVPLFLLHTGAVYGNERVDWEIEANSGDAVDAYCDANPGKTVGLYLATPAQQPAAAVPDDAIEAAYWDFDARHKGYGPHKTTPQSERDAFKWAVRAMLAAAAGEGGES